MSNTTIIELLNRIAKGEEVPKKIEFHGLIFEFDELERQYIHNDNDLDMTIDGLKYSSLNDTVEILEDEEIIDIDDIEELNEFIHIGDNVEPSIVDDRNVTINKLIRYLKQTKKAE